MEWSNLKSWKKGFMIGATIHLLYFLMFIPWIVKGGGETSMLWAYGFTELFPVGLIFFVLFMSSFLDNFLTRSPIGMIIVGLLATIIYGAVGALTGFIIGKMKGE